MKLLDVHPDSANRRELRGFLHQNLVTGFRLLLAVVLALTCASCESASPAAPTPVQPARRDTTIANLTYGASTAQVLDLGLPASRTSATPLVVVVHGGGWTTGDKGDLGFMVAGLMQRGFAVANINYRLAPLAADNLAMQLDDIGAAISVVLSRASADGFNGQKVYLVGHSAGAHLALSFAYARNATGRVKAVGSMAGPTNLFSLAYYNPFPGDWQVLLAPVLNAPLFPITTASDARYRGASPFYLATASSPPTILFHGDADPRVPIEQSASLATQLATLGVDRKYVVYSPFVFHDWWSDTARRDNTLDELASWFTAHP